MAKAITFTDETGQRVYTLEYTRNAVRSLERQGFTADKASQFPFTYYPMLFRAAFMAHHPDLTHWELDELFEIAPDKRKLIQLLWDMVYETVTTLYKPGQEDKFVPAQEHLPEPVGTDQHYFTELFDKMLPYFLAIGMTPEQYWDGDCHLTRDYMEAHEMRMSLENQRLWIQGAYFYNALCAVAPVLNAFAKEGTKPLPYLKEPIPLTKEDVDDSKRREEKRVMEVGKAKLSAWMKAINGKQSKIGADV